MSEIDKRIDSLINRFDNVLFSDEQGEEGGDFAFDEAVNFLIQYPQYLFVLEKLYPQLTHSCPNGTRRTLRIDEVDSLYDSDSDSCGYIGNEEFADRPRLSIALALPAQNATSEPTLEEEKEAEQERPEVTTLKNFVATFAKSQQKFNGYITVTFD